MDIELQNLIDNKVHKQKSAEDIVDRASKRRMTQEEKDQVKALKKEVADLETEISAYEEEQELRKSVFSKGRAPEARKTFEAPEAPEAPEKRKVYAQPHNFGNLKNFDTKSEEGRKQCWDAVQEVRAKYLGNEAAKRYCKDHGIETRSSLVIGTGNLGGDLIASPISSTIINYAEKFGVGRANAFVFPMTGVSQKVPKWANRVSVVKKAETVSTTETNPTFGYLTHNAEVFGGHSFLSNEILQDAVAPNLVDLLVQDFGRAFAKKEDQEIFGYSSVDFDGIVDVMQDGSHNGANTYTSTHNDFSKVDNADILKTISKLSPVVENPVIYCSDACWWNVFVRLGVSAPGNTLNTLFAGPTGKQYMGIPVKTSNVFPSSTGTLNDVVMFMIGDAAQTVQLGVRKEIEMHTSTERKNLEGQLLIYGFSRFSVEVDNLGDNNPNTSSMVGFQGKA